MASSIAIRISGIGLVVMVGATAAYAAQHSAEQGTLSAFHQSIAHYVELHHSIESRLPPLEISPDARKIHEAVEARAAALRRARAGARMGDVFTPEVSELFRNRIRQALLDRGYRIEEVRRQLESDTEGSDPPIVNGRFSWVTATATLPCVLAALPPLPRELQYRFAGADLVLIDIDANFIIDVLPNALGIAPRSGTA
jgi:hypothetical protein